MGEVIVQPYTTVNPITMMGEEAAVCYNSNTSDKQKLFERGCKCLIANHGRVMEYPQVYLVLDGYSARVIRELYTHIGGSPTRLQSSTRYIKYGEFDYITPSSIWNDDNAEKQYDTIMEQIQDAYGRLIRLGIPQEDAANVLPMGMSTKIVFRTNLRHLMEIMEVRQCTRAYWEMRNMMHDIKISLALYSEEWSYIVDNYMPCKCIKSGYCTEERSCGKRPKKKHTLLIND